MTVAAALAERRERPTVQRDAAGRKIYEPDGRQLARFLVDRSEIAIIRGPWGSGTSTACVQRIWQHLIEQNRGDDGFRKSRWFVMRESYPRIETTTLATWLEWMPEREYGKLYTGSRPYLHEIRVGDIKADIWFGASDDSASDAMFKSLEPTGWWWNEIEFQQMAAFFAAHGRVGRYPRAVDGGSRWSGSIADLNAPPENHWLPMLTGEVPLPDDMSDDLRMAFDVGEIRASGVVLPERALASRRHGPGMAYFVQPPAVLEVKDEAGRIIDWKVNPDAENLRWLADYDADPPEEIPGENYYRRAMHGKTIRWIQANLGNRIVPRVEGDPVYPSFDEAMHVARQPLEPVPNEDVIVGLDFGRRPAAVFMQNVRGQHQYQFEATMENAGASKFAPKLREILAVHYPWVLSHGAKAKLRIWGDPKGQDGTQTDERTAYDVFAAHGLKVMPAPVKGNNILTRIEAVEYRLERAPGGKPDILISPFCGRLKLALGGGYRYQKEGATPMTERKPIKDKHSDIADAMQYAELGEGSGRAMIGREDRPRPVDLRGRRRSYRRGVG